MCCSIGKIIRFAKIIVLFTVGMLALLVVFGNITDYNSNYQFVRHILSMDTTMEGNSIMYRAITSTALHHAAYIIIICWETLVMLLCFKGVYDMTKNINGTAEEFHKAKAFGILGLTACCILWFFGFQVIAAEWYGMWMSKWNGLPDATRLVTYMFLSMIFISIKNDD